MERIIFLDIDGVLNSKKYYQSGNTQIIDESRLELLKSLVDKTGGKIVLSSSWRTHWEKEYGQCDKTGQQITDIFKKHGLEIYDKTPIGYSFDRTSEIAYWLNSHAGQVTSFVILDDIFYGWGNLRDNLVLTDYYIGYGLEENHIENAYKILMGKGR